MIAMRRRQRSLAPRPRGLRGIAAPVLVREPVLVRVCVALVDNLAIILRLGLMVGALFLIRDLRGVTDDLQPTVAELVPPTSGASATVTVHPERREPPVRNERVEHYLKCTYKDYRDAHFEACVDGPSSVYRKPEPDPDNTGRVWPEEPVRTLRLAHTGKRDMTAEIS